MIRPHEKGGVARQWHTMARDLDVRPYVRWKLGSALYELSEHHRLTARHSMRVGILAAQIGEVDGIDPERRKPLFYGGSMHDYGKICVDAALLSKTTTWTEQDAAALRRHPIDGYHALMEKGMAVTAAIVARHHTFQENGYPKQPPELPDELAHLSELVEHSARVVALADYYDAAHRLDSDAGASGAAIEEKIRAHNTDVADLVGRLYDRGVFSRDDSWYMNNVA